MTGGYATNVAGEHLERLTSSPGVVSRMVNTCSLHGETGEKTVYHLGSTCVCCGEETVDRLVSCRTGWYWYIVTATTGVPAPPTP